MKQTASLALIAALIAAPMASFAQTTPVSPEDAMATVRGALAENGAGGEIELMVREEIDGQEVYIFEIDYDNEEILFVDAATGELIRNEDWAEMVEEELDDMDDDDDYDDHHDDEHDDDHDEDHDEDDDDMDDDMDDKEGDDMTEEATSAN